MPFSFCSHYTQITCTSAPSNCVHKSLVSSRTVNHPRKIVNCNTIVAITAITIFTSILFFYLNHKVFFLFTFLLLVRLICTACLPSSTLCCLFFAELRPTGLARVVNSLQQSRTTVSSRSYRVSRSVRSECSLSRCVCPRCVVPEPLTPRYPFLIFF